MHFILPAQPILAIMPILLNNEQDGHDSRDRLRR